jgi:hypothetical protein
LGFALFANDGPVVADAAATDTPLRVVLATQTSSKVGEMTNEELVAAIGRASIRDGAARSIGTIEVHTGPIRTFEFYRANPKQTGQSVLDDENTKAVLTSITSFERKRGAVMSANEQPVLVGDVMVREVAERQQPYTDWTHLKRGFSWETVAWAAALGALAMLVYVVARALGWVIDGFVSR